MDRIVTVMKALGPRGGRVRLPAVSYDLESALEIDQPCVFLEGDVWAYSADPNGVFESRCGTKLRLRGRGFPALSVGVTRTAEGCVIRNLGIQGDIVGIISSSHAASMVVRGAGNVLMNNVVDGDVVVEGSGNVVSGLVFTTPDTRLILRGENNRAWGVPKDRIVC